MIHNKLSSSVYVSIRFMGNAELNTERGKCTCSETITNNIVSE